MAIYGNQVGGQASVKEAKNVTGTVAIVNGGTGATTAAAARTNLNVAIKDVESFTQYGGALASTTNCLLIDSTSPVGSANHDMQISVADASTLENCPVSSGGFTAYRKVIPIKQTSGDFDYMVMLIESQPTEGRIWENLYSYYWKTWSGWKLINSSHTQSADTITSGTLPVERGGTGAGTAAEACTNLGARTTTDNTIVYKELTNTADLNSETYRQPGFYRISYNNHSVTNTPSGLGKLAFELIVTGISNNKTYCTQEVKAYNSERRWIRSQISSNADSLNWTTWKEIPIIEYGTALPSAGTAGRLFFKKV